MMIKTILENNGFTDKIETVSNEILNLKIRDFIEIKEYGNSRFDLFDGATIVCEDCEINLNFEDNEFTPMALTYIDDEDNYHELGFDTKGKFLFEYCDGVEIIRN